MERSTRTRYNLRPTAVDPITQEPIARAFKLRMHTAAHTYDAASLARTILAMTGPPRDPITQLPIPQSELQRLDAELAVDGICLPPVAGLHTRKPATLSADQCMVEVLELRIADNVTAIFTILEDAHAAEAYIQVYFSIMMVCIPDVVQHLRSIAHHDIDHAKHLRQSILERLHGPPNRRTFDPTDRVLGFALATLRELAL